jgi:predicted metal-dependent HD superfamily phosphohydrolase
MSDLSLLQPTREDLSFLHEQWVSLAGQYGAPRAAQERWFASIAQRYSEDTRFYHNLHHISEMLRLVDSYRGIRDKDAVSFAAWFHDAIYKTRKSNNEEKSAILATKALSELGAAAETVTEVEQLVLATKRHESECLRPDAMIFLDADLSILGAAEEVYLQYSAAIRKEYAWVEACLYRRERKKVLEGFLTCTRIYCTDEMFERFETQARQNIRGEIKLLEAGS